MRIQIFYHIFARAQKAALSKLWKDYLFVFQTIFRPKQTKTALLETT